MSYPIQFQFNSFSKQEAYLRCLDFVTILLTLFLIQTFAFLKFTSFKFLDFNPAYMYSIPSTFYLAIFKECNRIFKLINYLALNFTIYYSF
jgi:hypothetical protein